MGVCAIKDPIDPRAEQTNLAGGVEPFPQVEYVLDSESLGVDGAGVRAGQEQ